VFKWSSDFHSERLLGRDVSQGLRRRLTSYGDPAFSLFLRKAFIKAMGYSDDALDRPIVGITNTYSDYNPCHGNALQLVDAARRGVMLAGAADGLSNHQHPRELRQSDLDVLAT
jgi:dihydroxyacid dehydratase/phosphogluconate dehydratase